MYNENQNSSGAGQWFDAHMVGAMLLAPDDTNSLAETSNNVPKGLRAVVSASDTNSTDVDHRQDAQQATPRTSASVEPLSSGKDHATGAVPARLQLSPPDENTIAAIRAAHRQRQFAMKQRKRADLALGSFLRLMFGWRRDLPKDESDRIKAQAAAIMKNPSGEWASVIEAAQRSREPFETVEKDAQKRMEKLVKATPLWKEFGEPIKGFGPASMATIIAEAGDLSKYPTKSHLWKRLGLAVLDGQRQGNPGAKATADDWIRHGYNRERRSLVFQIGDSMLKKQIGKVKDEAGEDTGERIPLGYYGEVYLARKQYELMRDPEMKPIQVHRRAQRYMEKRLVKNLWQAWRRDRGLNAERPSDVDFLQAAE